MANHAPPSTGALHSMLACTARFFGISGLVPLLALWTVVSAVYRALWFKSCHALHVCYSSYVFVPWVITRWIMVGIITWCTHGRTHVLMLLTVGFLFCDIHELWFQYGTPKSAHILQQDCTVVVRTHDLGTFILSLKFTLRL
jgi:hypothetical protein